MQAKYDKLRGTVVGRSSEKLPPIQSEVRRAVEEEELALDLGADATERALRIIATGRKNFLFVADEEAGQNLAILQTLCSTCLLHVIDPYDYLKDVLSSAQRAILSIESTSSCR